MASLQFDSTGIDITPRFDPVPDGEYTVIITESDLRETKNGNGQYLNLTLEVQGGEFQGRKLWDRLNLINQNATAVEIAQRQLGQICHAVGVLQVNDSSELHYKPLVAIVRIRKEEGREPSNEIKGYKAASGATSAGLQAPAKPAANATAPWAKKAA